MLDAFTSILRVALIFTIWFFVWRLITPKTQLARIARAAILVASMLLVLAILRTLGL